MTKIKLLTAAISAVGMILLLVWIQGGFSHKVPGGVTNLPKERIEQLKTIKVELVETSGEVSVSGTVLARDTARIAARVGGYVTELKVDAGSIVKKGDLLLKIEARELEEREAQARAALESANVDLEKNRQDLERYKVLFEGQAIARKEFDDVSARFEMAKAAADKAKSALEEAKTFLSYELVTAPFDGIVLSSTFADGEFAGPGMTAISVISSQFIIKADINETDIAKLTPGQKVEMTLDAYPDKLLEGEIAEISPISRNLAGIVSFEIKVKPDDLAQSYLKYGLSANVTIIISKVENVLYVPLQSVYEENGKKYVDILAENNEFKKIEITTGNYNYDYIEIKSGLEQGDEIITSVIEEAAASGNMFGQ